MSPLRFGPDDRDYSVDGSLAMRLTNSGTQAPPAPPTWGHRFWAPGHAQAIVGGTFGSDFLAFYTGGELITQRCSSNFTQSRIARPHRQFPGVAVTSRKMGSPLPEPRKKVCESVRGTINANGTMPKATGLHRLQPLHRLPTTITFTTAFSDVPSITTGILQPILLRR